MPKVSAQHTQAQVNDSTGYEMSDQDWLDAFRRRQQADQRRLDLEHTATIRRRNVNNEMAENCHRNTSSNDGSDEFDASNHAGQKWQDSEGDQLADFGVDDDVDFFDEDEIPLAHLLQRNKARASSGA